jgi:hypothetical protein
MTMSREQEPSKEKSNRKLSYRLRSLAGPPADSTRQSRRTARSESGVLVHQAFLLKIERAVLLEEDTPSNRDEKLRDYLCC